MVDTVSQGQRSRIMAAIPGKNTKPEMLVRKAVHARGFRYRLHCCHLPGKPDLVLSRFRLVIFVHGCFWHQHSACKLANTPKSRVDYWGPKLSRNVERDSKHQAELEQLGWRVETIWECEAKIATRLDARINDIFGL